MMKNILIWLFKDFLYRLYDMAESKFTLHFEAFVGLPQSQFPATPLMAMPGIVGVPYSSILYYAIRVDPTTEPPINYFPYEWEWDVNAVPGNNPGIPTGLNFYDGSVISTPSVSTFTPLPFTPPFPNPPVYDVLPNINALGANQINLVGTPTVAGVYDFMIRWKTAIGAGQFGAENYYQITIYETANDIPPPDETRDFPFTCNLPPPKKKRTTFGVIPVICCNPKINIVTGEITPCPDYIKTKDGVIYYKISCDKYGSCCYVRNDYRVKK